VISSRVLLLSVFNDYFEKGKQKRVVISSHVYYYYLFLMII
jgi:hypothetical protein